MHVNLKTSSFIVLLLILGGICFGAIGFLSLKAEKKATTKSLPEVYSRVNESLAFGSAPKDRADLQGLYDRGIRVVVSVDAARPLVEDANSVGLKIIHVPTRYSGIDGKAVGALRRISEENKEPIYIHCHHGKHRGPTAAAIVGMCKGLFSKDQALEIMEKAGTGADYRGLWKSVREFDPDARSSEIPELREVQAADRVAEQMLIADESLDRIKDYISQERTTEGHADISHELLLISEAMAESLRFSDPAGRELTERYTKITLELEQVGRSLPEGTPRSFKEELQNLENSCKSCHRAHRN